MLAAGGKDVKMWSGVVKASTVAQYTSSVQKFCKRVDSNVHISLQPESSWDSLVAQYIISLRGAGKHASQGRPVTAGLRHFLPETPLPKSFRTLKAWTLDSNSQGHACMSNSANLVLVNAAVQRGWYHVAAWLRVSFVCLLRVSAASQILWPSVFLPGDERLLDFPGKCFVKIGRDKRHSTSVMVDVPDELAVSLLRYMVLSRRRGDLRLFRAEAPTLRKKMRSICADLHWTHLNLVPHSLRYGGAVDDRYVRGLSMDEVQTRGR